MTLEISKKQIAVAVAAALSGFSAGAYANGFSDISSITASTAAGVNVLPSATASLGSQTVDITESLADTVIGGTNVSKTIKLTLSNGAKWVTTGAAAVPAALPDFTVSTVASTGVAVYKTNVVAADFSSNGTVLTLALPPADPKAGEINSIRLAGFTIDTSSSSAGDVNMTLSAGTASGIAGATTVKIANVVGAGVTVTASGSVPNAKAGDVNVTLPVLTVAELAAGSLNDKVKDTGATGGNFVDDVKVTLPTGFTFSTDPAVLFNGAAPVATDAECLGDSSATCGVATQTNKSTIAFDRQLGLTTAAAKISLVEAGQTTGAKIFVPANAAAGDVNATVSVRLSNGTISTSTVKVATVGSTGLAMTLKDAGATGVATVYTNRNYTAGVNSGALLDGVTVTEGVANSLAATGTMRFTLGNASYTVAGALNQDTAGTGEFNIGTAVAGAGLVPGAVSNTTAPFIYSEAAVIDAGSGKSSNAVGDGRVFTFPNITTGAVVGPVTVALSGTSISSSIQSSLTPVTIANAINATKITAGSQPLTVQANQQGAAIPKVIVTEAAAGALVKTDGTKGSVWLGVNNGSWSAEEPKVTWCGAAVPSTNVIGAGTALLEVALPSVSSAAACALEVTGKVNVISTIKPGEAVSISSGTFARTVGEDLTRTAQPTVETVIVAQMVESDRTIFTAATSGTATAQTLTATVGVAQNEIGRNGNIYVGALWQGNWFFLNSAGNWVRYSGGAFTPYATGPLQRQNVEVYKNLDTTGLLKGAEVWVGYGFNDADMMNNGKFGKVQTVGQ